MENNWYERNLLPHLVNLACGTPPIRKQRMKIIPRATGRVLEVGIGSGLNIPFYDLSRIKTLTGIDTMLNIPQLALKRIESAGIDIRLVCLSAEKLPIADASFDTVVSTYTLCTLQNPLIALNEIRRVLAPGGRLLFSEHGRAPERDVEKWQTRLQPYWSRIAGGCMLDRDIPSLLRQAGFYPDVQSQYLFGPKILSYHYWGEAVAS